jgi:hypothetical protein
LLKITGRSVDVEYNLFWKKTIGILPAPFCIQLCTIRIRESTSCKRENDLLILLSIMHTDVRFKTVRDLINTRSITAFEQIFDTIPKSMLARELRKNTSRIDDIIQRPEELRYKEIKAISVLLDVPCSKIIQLFDKEFA